MSRAYYNEIDPYAAAWLVNGVTNRVGRLRAYGNAINASAAEAFIRSHQGI